VSQGQWLELRVIFNAVQGGGKQQLVVRVVECAVVPLTKVGFFVLLVQDLAGPQLQRVHRQLFRRATERVEIWQA
jgi:hypothetical protein